MTVRLMLGDCLDRMKEIPDGSVDMVFTSPPYNLGDNRGQYKQRGGQWRGAKLADGYASYSDNLPREKYVEWQKDVLRECWRVLSTTGAIFYNHKPRVQNNVLQTPLELNPGLPVRQIVIWKRSGGFNFSPSFYLPTHEWVIIYAKPGFRLRDRSASGAKDVWEVPQERGNAHPAPFPVALPTIAIETTTAETILDPFMGSGSTGVAAVQAGRQFIGIELDPSYFAIADTRIHGALASATSARSVKTA